MGEMIGKQSVKFAEAPYIFEGASVVGPKEGEDNKLFYIFIIIVNSFKLRYNVYMQKG